MFQFDYDPGNAMSEYSMSEYIGSGYAGSDHAAKSVLLVKDEPLEGEEPSLIGHYLFFLGGTLLGCLELYLYSVLPPFWSGFSLAAALPVCLAAFVMAHGEAVQYECFMAQQERRTAQDEAALARSDGPSFRV